MDEFKDRFDPKKYEEEKPVGIGFGISGTPAWWQDKEEGIVWVPGPLFARAQSIARAYDLNQMPAIDMYDRTELNKIQAETLLTELRFIRNVVNDSLLSKWLEKVENNVVKVVQSTKNIVVIIEGL